MSKRPSFCLYSKATARRSFFVPKYVREGIDSHLIFAGNHPIFHFLTLGEERLFVNKSGHSPIGH
jgi:hypothetical protein